MLISDNLWMEGGKVLEFWQGNKKLTFYDCDMSLIRSWGINIHGEMSDEIIENSEQMLAAWNWLHENYF